MQWNQIVENIKNFFDQPVPIICCSVGALLVFVLTVISKTSIGKRALNKLTSLINETKETAATTKALAETRINELKETYETKIAVVQSEYQELETLILSISANIRNENVKNILTTYQEKIIARKNDLQGYVETRVQEVKAEVETYKEQIKSEYEQIVATYKTAIEQYKSEFETLKEQYNDQIKEIEQKDEQE